MLFILFVIPNTLAIAANCVDIAYYDFTFKRTTFDVFEVMKHDLSSGGLIGSMFKDYWYVLFLWIGLTTLMVFLYFKIINKKTESHPYSLKIFIQEFFQFLIELHCRELQQPYGLLQLGRQREVLGQFELQGLLHR